MREITRGEIITLLQAEARERPDAFHRTVMVEGPSGRRELSARDAAREFLAPGGGADFLAQIVFTATPLPGVRVDLRFEEGLCEALLHPSLVRAAAAAKSAGVFDLLYFLAKQRRWQAIAPGHLDITSCSEELGIDEEFLTWVMARNHLSPSQIHCEILGGHDFAGYGSDGQFYDHTGRCQICGVDSEKAIDSSETALLEEGWDAARATQSPP